VPRSAFLEGAREAGGTKTCSGAIAKQKTAGPQGAASLSLAVLESNGRKREGSSDEQCGLWVVGRRGETRGGENVRAVTRLTVCKPAGACARQSALGADWRLEESRREEGVGALGNGPSLWPKKTAGREKVDLPTRGERACALSECAGSLLAARRGDSRFQNTQSVKTNRREACPPRGERAIIEQVGRLALNIQP